jgi:hypothetical protein
MPRRFPIDGSFRRVLAVAGTAATALTVTAALSGAAAAAPHQAAARASVPRASGRLMATFNAAARESGVPASLLLAIGYSESRWEPRGTTASADGGYGLMNLTARTSAVASAAGKSGSQPRRVSLVKTHYTLDAAARLLHVPASTLKTSDAENIRGAAAVLASYARALNGGRLPSALGGWYGAVAAYSGATTSQAAGLFAGQVFGALRSGAALTTSDGQAMRLPASPGLHPETAQLTRLGLKSGTASASTPTDCPAVLKCNFIPVTYTEAPGGDPGNYGDYDIASRPQNLKIYSIVIHDTEESYADTINTFTSTNPLSYTSANYVIRSSDGHVTEMLRPQNVAWAVGNWYYNTHSISIENEGFADQGNQWYTKAMYKSDGELVAYLAKRFDVPLDRVHIVGHDNVGGPTNADNAIQHWDPGPFWNWNYFMALAHHESESSYLRSQGSLTSAGHHVVTISPDYARNEPPVTDCDITNPAPLPKQPANFVYLHTAPKASAPLLSDPTLHTDGSPGTTCAEDWGDKASTGDQYVIAGQHGNWTGIWYAGTIGWFFNPHGAGQTARYTGATVVVPRPGLASVPVYGSAFPEASAYPKGVTVQSNTPLAYTIKAGQAYVTIGSVPDDYYNAITFNSSMPYDHTVIRGKTGYDEILLNHRIYYVKAADVKVKRLH